MEQGNVRRRITEDPGPGYREKLLRPPDKTFREKARDFFWDNKNKTCLTRTPSNWVSIGFYYAIFLGGVFLIFYISMRVAEYVASSDPNRPQYILDQSPIGTSPNVNFFPFQGSRNLIWLSANRPYSLYVDIITDTFKKYKKANKKFDTTAFGECGSPPFGYDTKTPCIFFRLNRLLMWTPLPYEKDDDFPDTMPEEVKTLIQSSATPRIWLSCNGTTPKDRDHMPQDFFHMCGQKGFDVSAFPYRNQKNYTDSIVAMKLKDTKPQKVLYSFTCTVWVREVDASKVGVDVTYYFE